MSALARRASRGLAIASLWLAAAIAHAGTVHYHYTDAQGTTLATADAQGAIVSTNDYAPYGSAAPNMSAAPDGPGYTGHVNDPDTGLVYMQARYYDPAVGRFLSVDPVTPDPGNLFNFNRFVYANNNPSANLDPDGRDPEYALFLTHLYGFFLNKAVDEQFVQPAKYAYTKIDENVEITASVAAAKGGGVGYQYNLLHPGDSGLYPIAGEGLNASVDVGLKHGWIFHLAGISEISDNKMDVSLEGGDVFHAGVAFSLDQNLNLEIKPKFGLGEGELGAYKTKHGSVSVEKEPSKRVDESEQLSLKDPNCSLAECGARSVSPVSTGMPTAGGDL